MPFLCYYDRMWEVARWPLCVRRTVVELRITIVAIETQNFFPFVKLTWNVAVKNVIYSESVAMEAKHCVVYIVAPYIYCRCQQCENHVGLHVKCQTFLFFSFFLSFWRSCDRASLMYSFKYNQQDATLYNILYYCQCSTCFGRFFRPSSAAQKLYTQHRVYAKLAATASDISKQAWHISDAVCTVFELLMMGEETAWNMYSIDNNQEYCITLHLLVILKRMPDISVKILIASWFSRQIFIKVPSTKFNLLAPEFCI